MSEIATPSAAQAPQEATPAAVPEVSFLDAADNLAIARMQNAAPSEILRLEEQVRSLSGPTETPTPPAAIEPPAAEPTPEQTPAETAEAPATEPPAGEEPTVVEPEAAEPADRIRIKDYPEAEQALVSTAHTLVKRLGITFSEAFARVSGQGITQAAPEIPAEPEVPKHIATMEQEVTTLEAELDALTADSPLMTPEVGKITKALSKANAKLEAARIGAQTSTIAEQTVSDATFVAQRGTVIESARRDYPDMLNKSTALFKLAQAEAQSMQSDPEHPLYAQRDTINAPRLAVEAAAKLLGKVPVSPNAVQKTAPASVPPVQVQKPAVTPVSGSRASAPPPPAKTEAQVIADKEEEVQRILNGGRPQRQSQMAVVIR